MDNSVILDWQGKTKFIYTSTMQWNSEHIAPNTTNPRWFEYDDVTITDGTAIT